MATTTVKVTRETSDELDSLAARLFLKTRRKITKQDLIDLLAKMGGKNEDALVAHILGGQRFSDAAWRRLLSSVSDWGVDTSKEDLDEILYGGEG